MSKPDPSEVCTVLSGSCECRFCLKKRIETLEMALQHVTLDEADLVGTVWEGKEDGAVFLSSATKRVITLNDYRLARAVLAGGEPSR